MIIINAVECKSINTLQNVVDRYLLDNPISTLFTDDKRIKKYVNSNYDSERCIYNSSLVGMWFMVNPDSIIVLTEIENTRSEVYIDLSKNYTIVSIEDSEELIPNDSLEFVNPIVFNGGV